MSRALLSIVPGVGDEPSLARQVCEACVRGLDIDGASVSVATTSAARYTLWASDPVAELLEELQFSLNEGACIQAATTGTPVLVSDLAESTEVTRWPVFAAAVAEQTPVRALFALPLQWGATNFGVLNFYRRAPGGLSPAQSRDALAAADITTLLMLGLHTHPHRSDETNTDIDAAQDSMDSDGQLDGWLDMVTGPRAHVHQAIGMVLVQLDISSTEALARMRAHAYAHQRLLTDVARDVVNHSLVFSKDTE